MFDFSDPNFQLGFHFAFGVLWALILTIGALSIALLLAVGLAGLLIGIVGFITGLKHVR